MSNTTFIQLNHALARASAPADAAECHGTLSGILSGGKPDLRDRWLDDSLLELRAAEQPVQECRQVLERLVDETRADLNSPEFGFAPLLPGDEAPLEERVNALSTWCQGFLYGLGLAEVGNPEELPHDVREVVEDLAEIARAGLAPGSDREADEEAYAELVEYLRVGVQLVHDELNPGTATFRAPPGLH